MLFHIFIIDRERSRNVSIYCIQNCLIPNSNPKIRSQTFVSFYACPGPMWRWCQLWFRLIDVLYG